MIKSIPSFVLFVLISTLSMAQVDWGQFEAIVEVKGNDPKQLANEITAPYSEEIDKARAIYYWMTHNIAYDYQMLQDLPKIIAKNRGKTYTFEEIEKMEEEEILKALKRKKGVCQQYSRVFQRLCKEAGIHAEFIGGLSKNNSNTRPSDGFSHAWNAVQIGELYGLVDVTYGAGYLDEHGTFHFNFSPSYFCASIEPFGMNHLPEEDNWQLQSEVFTKEEFRDFPYVGAGSIRYNVTNLSPQNVLITANRNEDITIDFDAEYEISQIRCWNEGTGYPVEISLEVEGKHHYITLPSKELKTGVYLFRVGDEDLFSYRITIR